MMTKHDARQDYDPPQLEPHVHGPEDWGQLVTWYLGDQDVGAVLMTLHQNGWYSSLESPYAWLASERGKAWTCDLSPNQKGDLPKRYTVEGVGPTAIAAVHAAVDLLRKAFEEE